MNKHHEDVAEDAMPSEDVDVKEEDVKVEMSVEEKMHLDARDMRVAGVKTAIEAAKLIRDEQELVGTVETEGVKLDRLATEKKAMEDAERVNVIEPFSVVTHSEDDKLIVEKLSEVIDYLNSHAL